MACVLLLLKGIGLKLLTSILALTQCLPQLEWGILISGISKILFRNRAQYGVNKPTETSLALLSTAIVL
jgi:hypothetical protein